MKKNNIIQIIIFSISILFIILSTILLWDNPLFEYNPLIIIFGIGIVIGLLHSSIVVNRFIDNLSLGLTRKEIVKNYYKNYGALYLILIFYSLLYLITILILSNDFNFLNYLKQFIGLSSLFFISTSIVLLIRLIFDNKILILIIMITIIFAYMILNVFQASNYIRPIGISIVINIICINKILNTYKAI